MPQYKLGICKICQKYKQINGGLCKQCKRIVGNRKIVLKTNTKEKGGKAIGFKTSGTKMLIPTNTHGYVIPHDEWLEISKRVDAFFGKTTTSQIKKVNTAIGKENHLNIIPKEKLGTIPGYVYLLKSENGFYKIGKTKDINKRLEQIQKEYPVKIKLIHFIKTDDYTALENKFHRAYDQYRTDTTEWFKLPEKAVDEICSHESSENEVL